MTIVQEVGSEMGGIVPVHQEQGRLWADARTLHAALQIGRDFSTWVRTRLEEAGAVEGEEFVVLDGSPILGSKWGGANRRDYWLSLDLAKEMAMLERSEVGKNIRRYFIEAEKKMRTQQVALPNFSNPIEAARAWADAEEARMLAQQAEQAAQEQLATIAPQAAQFQALMSAEGTYSVAEAAKLLGTGEGRLFKLLRERHVFQDRERSGHEHHNVPYQAYLDRGYFELITRPRPDGKRVTYTPRVTAKGLAWLQRQMTQQQLLPVALPLAAGAEA